jgi:hypothetical protein
MTRCMSSVSIPMTASPSIVAHTIGGTIADNQDQFGMLIPKVHGTGAAAMMERFHRLFLRGLHEYRRGPAPRVAICQVGR